MRYDDDDDDNNDCIGDADGPRYNDDDDNNNIDGGGGGTQPVVPISIRRVYIIILYRYDIIMCSVYTYNGR